MTWGRPCSGSLVCTGNGDSILTHPRSTLQHLFRAIAAPAIALLAAGCNPIAKTVSKFVQDGSPSEGVTFYVGGAGPIGNIGSIDVPSGLQDAGYRGYTEVFTWQSVTAAIDQFALARNRGKGAELADRIRMRSRESPRAPIHIIALSAGTGIATFALERLPETVRVKSVVFLASSMSSRYDLSRALRRVDDGLYLFYSPDDPILSTLVPYTGTVDRRDAEIGVAGLQGFRPPPAALQAADTRELYARVHNVRHRPSFNRYGYEGGHIDTTSREFIAKVVAPLLLGDELTRPSIRRPARREASDSGARRPSRGPAPADRERRETDSGADEPPAKTDAEPDAADVPGEPQPE